MEHLKKELLDILKPQGYRQVLDTYEASNANRDEVQLFGLALPHAAYELVLAAKGAFPDKETPRAQMIQELCFLLYGLLMVYQDENHKLGLEKKQLLKAITVFCNNIESFSAEDILAIYNALGKVCLLFSVTNRSESTDNE